MHFSFECIQKTAEQSASALTATANKTYDLEWLSAGTGCRNAYPQFKN